MSCPLRLIVLVKRSFAGAVLEADALQCLTGCAFEHLSLCLSLFLFQSTCPFLPSSLHPQEDAVPALMILKRALTLLLLMASLQAEITWFLGLPTEEKKEWGHSDYGVLRETVLNIHNVHKNSGAPPPSAPLSKQWSQDSNHANTKQSKHI